MDSLASVRITLRNLPKLRDINNLQNSPGLRPNGVSDNWFFHTKIFRLPSSARRLVRPKGPPPYPHSILMQTSIKFLTFGLAFPFQKQLGPCFGKLVFQKMLQSLPRAGPSIRKRVINIDGMIVLVSFLTNPQTNRAR